MDFDSLNTSLLQLVFLMLRINFNVCLSTKSAHTLSDYVLKKEMTTKNVGYNQNLQIQRKECLSFVSHMEAPRKVDLC